MRTSRVFYALFALGMLTGLHGLKACGLNFSLTEFHFNSVNEQGCVSYWDRLGEIPLDDQGKLPIDVHFLSSRKSSSPYAGFAWTVPVLESYMVQLDENTFRFWQPNGRYRTFRRDKKNPNVLNAGDWKAELQGNDQITAWANCGWKFVLNKGKIASFSTPANKTYRYEYQDGKAVGIVENVTGKRILEVQQDPKNALKTWIVFGDKKVLLELGKKPKIQNINGQNLVGEVEKSLVSATLSDGTVHSYVFAVDEKIRPTLKLENDRLIVWNPLTMKIIQDGEWIYEIPSHETSLLNRQNLPLRRTNAQGKKEFWFQDNAKGVETIVSQDGTTFTKEWFTSGKLDGLKRTETIKKNGEIIKAVTYSYDEEGRILRKTLSGKNIEGSKISYEYKGDISIERMEQNGQKIVSYYRNGKLGRYFVEQ